MLKFLLVLAPVIKGSVVWFQYKTVAPVQGDCSHNQVNIPSVGASRLQQEKQEAEGLSPAYLRKSASSQRYSWKQPSHLLSVTISIHRLSLQLHSAVEGSGTKHLFLISSLHFLPSKKMFVAITQKSSVWLYYSHGRRERSSTLSEMASGQ